MTARTLKANITGIVLTGTWECEGHTISFTEVKNDKNKMKIVEVMRGNSWQSQKRNWSMIKEISLDEAIEEQNKLIKYGYRRINQMINFLTISNYGEQNEK